MDRVGTRHAKLSQLRQLVAANFSELLLFRDKFAYFRRFCANLRCFYTFLGPIFPGAIFTGAYCLFCVSRVDHVQVF